jgi:cytidylate kinase
MNTRNIIISGWPVSGSTTMALILANLLGYKYVYAGGVFKHFTKEIYGSDSSHNVVRFEEEYGTHWDSIWEKYAQLLLESETRLLCDSKLTGFIYKGENVFKIMFTANFGTRMTRAAIDGRGGADIEIQQRDEQLSQRWSRDFGVNIYDNQTIVNNFDLSIDNSELSIAQTLMQLCEKLSPAGFDLNINPAQAQELEQHYWHDGKSYFLRKLELSGLQIDVADVFATWREKFTADVEALPEVLRDVIQSI